MKIIIAVLIVFSSDTFALICDGEGSLGSLSAIEGTKCISDEVDKNEIGMSFGRRDMTVSNCNNCKNPLLENILKNQDAKEERKSIYAGAILNEFQKELSFLSMDLLKSRSSFKLPFNASKSIKSCQFDKQLKTPKCLKGKDLDQFNDRLKSIKTSLANELSKVLSGADNGTEGLYTRSSKQCEPEIQDREILNAQMRFSESLLTPKFIESLEREHIPSNTTFETFASEKNLGISKELISNLSQHPIFLQLLNNTSALNDFIKEVKENPSKSIIEILYSPKNAKLFGESIENRCKDVFKKTSEYLDDVYCKKDKNYVADNASTMQAISGTNYNEMTDAQAENEIKTHCSILNNGSDQDNSFSVIMKDINGKNNKLLAEAPITEFKKDFFKKNILNPEMSICMAMNGAVDCSKETELSDCKLLKFYNLSKNDQEYKKISETSGDNINQILRSLIGDGLPQKDGKPDQQAILVLKSEGILPGGDTSARPPQQDAGSFHRAVANNNNSIKPPTSQAAKAPVPAAPAQPAPTSQATTSLSDDSQYDSQSDSQSDATRIKTDSTKTKNSFSALSDEEQMNLLNRMKPKTNSKKPGRTAKSASSNDKDESYLNPGKNFNSGSFATDQAAVAADNTAVDKLAIPQSEGHSGTRAKLDPKKIDKDASFNEAKIQASLNRGPASDITNDTVISLSKTDGGLNKIEIKVPDESVLGKKTPELESKIQDYLDKSGQSLQGAKKGEAFIVKLGKYDIKVSINDYGVYVATCKDKSIHPDYLAFLSRYFTGIKERVSSTETMKKVLIESTSSK